MTPIYPSRLLDASYGAQKGPLLVVQRNRVSLLMWLVQDSVFRGDSGWFSPTSAEPFMFRYEHHLRDNALQRMARYGLDQVPNAMAKLDQAFQSPQGWTAFRRCVSGSIGVNAWCQKFDAQVRAQTSWRPRLPQHHSNGAVEAELVTTKAAIDDRHAVLRNKFRTNQLLELVRANINHQADVATFARTLRTSLEAGVTAAHQLSCVDRGTRTMRVNGVKVIRPGFPADSTPWKRGWSHGQEAGGTDEVSG